MLAYLIFDYLKKNQIILALVMLAAGWLIYRIGAIFVILFVAYIIMTGLTPVVALLMKARIPRPLAITFPYLVIFFLLILGVRSAMPFAASQLESLSESLPQYVTSLGESLGIGANEENARNILLSPINTIQDAVVDLTGKVLSIIFGLVAVLIISVYMLFDKERITAFMVNLFPEPNKKYAHSFIEQTETKLGAWIRGQIIIAAAVGIMVWISLLVVGVEHAFTLALFAAFMEFIPFIGPIIAAVPAIIVGFSISPATAVLILFIFAAIQQIENHLLAPKVMQKVIGLHPILVIIALLVGAQLAGIIGALLAIPVSALIMVVSSELDKITRDKYEREFTGRV